MKALLIVISLLVVAAVGVYGAGSALPGEHVLMRGALIARPIGEVWQAVSDYGALPQWNPQIVSAERGGEAAGGHPLWRLEDAEGNHMLLEVEEFRPPARQALRVVESSRPFRGRWVIELVPQAAGTWVKLTEEGSVPGPFARFLLYYITGPDSGMTQFFENLGKKFGQPVKVEELVA